jgi:hypothetical protein
MLRIIRQLVSCLSAAAGMMMFSTVGHAQVELTDHLSISANCEVQIKSVERVMNLSKTTGHKIFVISRRGFRERANIDWSRLSYVRAVLTQSRGFPAEKLILGAGERRSTSTGVLEFWVGSDLLLEISRSRNQRPCLMTPEGPA